MKLILRENGEVIAKLEVPDNSAKHKKIKYRYSCIECVKIHLAEFKYVSIHDDGMIYELVGVHQ